MTDSKTSDWSNPDQDKIAEILRNIKTIAVVGMSGKPDRASHRVGQYLMFKGYEVIPVNPAETEILGQKCFPDLASIGKPIDLVDIFRKGDATPPIVEEAISVKVRYIWLQEGVISQESFDLARAANIPIVMDRCMLKEHSRLGA